MTSPVPTATPAERSSWPKSTSDPAREAGPCSGSGTGDDLLQALPHQIEVVPLLDDRAQGVLRRLDVEIALAENVQRHHPVERLGDAGRLGEVQVTKPVHRRDHLAGQRLRHDRDTDEHDLELALGAGVPDPVVEAAALQRVVELA